MVGPWVWLFGLRPGFGAEPRGKGEESGKKPSPSWNDERVGQRFGVVHIFQRSEALAVALGLGKQRF